MKKGKRAGDSPIGIDVIEGKSYFWCTCGISSKQPFCDGSHKETEFVPLKYLAGLTGAKRKKREQEILKARKQYKNKTLSKSSMNKLAKRRAKDGKKKK